MCADTGSRYESRYRGRDVVRKHPAPKNPAIPVPKTASAVATPRAPLLEFHSLIASFWRVEDTPEVAERVQLPGRRAALGHASDMRAGSGRDHRRVVVSRQGRGTGPWRVWRWRSGGPRDSAAGVSRIQAAAGAGRRDHATVRAGNVAEMGGRAGWLVPDSGAPALAAGAGGGRGRRGDDGQLAGFAVRRVKRHHWTNSGWNSTHGGRRSHHKRCIHPAPPDVPPARSQDLEDRRELPRVLGAEHRFGVLFSGTGPVVRVFVLAGGKARQQRCTE